MVYAEGASPPQAARTVGQRRVRRSAVDVAGLALKDEARRDALVLRKHPDVVIAVGRDRKRVAVAFAPVEAEDQPRWAGRVGSLAAPILSHSVS